MTATRPDTPRRDAGRLPPGARASPRFARHPGEAGRAVRVLVDVHEQRSGILEGLEALGADVSVTRLAAGDYLLGADTLVERKRVMDLHTSVSDGRFWPQLLAIRDAARRAYLLVEGTDLDRGPLHPASVRTLLIAAIECGVPVLRSYQQRDSAVWLYRLALRRRHPGRTRDRPPYAQRRPPGAGAAAAEALLAAVPGISTASSRALLARFGSVAGVLAAGAEAWLEVPGIGPTRARALEETLRLGFPGAGGRKEARA